MNPAKDGVSDNTGEARHSALASSPGREDIQDLKSLYVDAAQSAAELARQITRLAQQHPFTAMVLSAAAGFLLGWTAAQRR
jgi:ElaB/YqjD/DUF883 family membrane-anchored ribosome-binding protein